MEFSETSDSGPSERGTQYNRPLSIKDTGEGPKFCFPIHFEPPKRGQPLYKGHKS